MLCYVGQQGRTDGEGLGVQPPCCQDGERPVTVESLIVSQSADG